MSDVPAPIPQEAPLPLPPELVEVISRIKQVPEEHRIQAFTALYLHDPRGQIAQHVQRVIAEVSSPDGALQRALIGLVPVLESGEIPESRAFWT